MIDYSEARDIVRKNEPDAKVRSVIERDPVLIFELEPEPDSNLLGVNLYNLAAVNRRTGEYIENYDPVN